MFELAEEHRMLQDLVAKFVNQELMPLERAVLAREAGGGKVGLTEAEEAPLHAKCKELGLWGLDVPEELGGANLPTVALMAVNEELGRTCVPFFFPPDSPNLHMLMAVVNDDQRARYLLPYADGSAKSAIGAKLNGVKASRTIAESVVAPCAMIRSRTFTLALSPPQVPTRNSFLIPYSLISSCT